MDIACENKEGVMNDATVPYELGLLEDLADPDEAMAYLEAALDDGDKALIRLAFGHVIEAQEISQGDDRRVKLAQSRKLRAILDAAEARIRATGGIRHEDMWNQLDAEYEVPDLADRDEG
jgi:DNA-binding phage protein